MKVTILTHTENPEKLIAAAAKLCYSNANIDKLWDGLDQAKNAEFVEMLASIGHESPIEHCNFTFAIEGVSRALLAQITRHRIASFSVQSQRYVMENKFDFVTPPEISACPQAEQIFLRSMAQAHEDYKDLTEILSENHAKKLIEAGESPESAQKKAAKMAIEDARFVLPNACATKMIITMNARALLNFFKQRCCRRAQWEIRQVADEMLFLVRDIAPTLFKNSGPPCLNAPCPEGKMSCGKILEVRKQYKSNN